jgi:hypothetical protein
MLRCDVGGRDTAISAAGKKSGDQSSNRTKQRVPIGGKILRLRNLLESPRLGTLGHSDRLSPVRSHAPDNIAIGSART